MMSNIRVEKVYLDLDGCLSEFMNSALTAIGVTRELADLVVPPGEWNFTRHFFKDDADFWNLINSNPQFWENLEKTDDADQLLCICEEFFGDQVFLLTSPPNAPESFMGKAKWVKKHYPHLYRKLFIGARKEALAHPGVVLVDDSDDNTNKFRLAGGKAVLVPRRWNSGHLEADKATTIVRLNLGAML